MKPSINQQIKRMFISETKGLLKKLERVLNMLNTDLTNQLLIDEAFRHFHSIKGSASMIAYNKTNELSQLLENLYDFARKEIFLTEAMIELSLESVSMIQILLENEEEISREKGGQYANLLKNLRDTHNEYQNYMDWKNRKYEACTRQAGNNKTKI